MIYVFIFYLQTSSNLLGGMRNGNIKENEMLARAGIKPRTAAGTGTITANTARTALGNISNRNALATNNQQGKEVCGVLLCFYFILFENRPATIKDR